MHINRRTAIAYNGVMLTCWQRMTIIRSIDALYRYSVVVNLHLHFYHLIIFFNTNTMILRGNFEKNLTKFITLCRLYVTLRYVTLRICQWTRITNSVVWHATTESAQPSCKKSHDQLTIFNLLHRIIILALVLFVRTTNKFACFSYALVGVGVRLVLLF